MRSINRTLIRHCNFFVLRELRAPRSRSTLLLFGILALAIVAGLYPRVIGLASQTFARHEPQQLLLPLGVAAPSWDAKSDARSGDAGRNARDLRNDFGKFPLYFVENRGQLDKKIAYYIPGVDKTVYLAADGLTFSFARRGPGGGGQRWAVKLDFVDANPSVQPEGVQQSETIVSYFSGAPSAWKAGLHSVSKVVYRELWPGIDLVYSGTASRLKYSFNVKPGADPARIRLAYRGAQSVRLSPDGELEVSTPLGAFHDESPISFQENKGAPSQVATAYQLLAREGSTGVSYGFRIGGYDRTRELVIDPAVIIYCGFVGGDGDDFANAIAVDTVGNAYIAGETSSAHLTFPVTAGPDLLYNGGPSDAFVAKVNPAGNALAYLGYIGGASSDRATGIAVDTSGNAYISGETFSNQTSFPVVVGPGLTYARNGDAFVAKVNAAGTALEYCGYIGGDGRDFTSAIAIDPTRGAYVVGTTDSNELSFPVTVGPRLLYSGEVDAYVAKINTAGTALVYCGYIGGTGDDLGRDIAVSSTGEAYIVGDTHSTQATFPVAVGPDLTYNGGDRDGFVAKISATGSAFLFNGYVGGIGSDNVHSIAVDGAGNSFLTGETTSDQTSFPVVVGPDLTFNGANDVFVGKLNSAGTAFVYLGYIGGTGQESGLAIEIDLLGNAYVAGETSSFQTSFPVVGGPQLHANGVLDGFVAKLNATGNALIYCGYLGGNANERVNGIAVDSNGNAYVAGYTESDQQTFPVVFGPDLTFNGGSIDAFVARIERHADVTPPSVASVGAVTRSRGSSGTATLAFLSDEDTRPGNIFVGLKNVPGSIIVTDLANNNGTVTATLTVPCGAQTGSFLLVVEATDGAGLKSSSEVTLNVTVNTAPVLGSYPGTQILTVGGSATITPATPPNDNGTIETMDATAAGFTGLLSVNKATGVITVQNAGPRELYVVTVTATDNCQLSSLTTSQLSVGQPNPVPAITNVSPGLIAVGTPGVVVTVTGSSFASDSKVLWNNSVRATTFVSAQELKAAITTQDLAALGTRTVVVSSSAPGGGVSNALTVSVVNTVAATNAASFSGSSIASDSIVALFGINLATGTSAGGTVPLPTQIAGTQVTVRDSAGTERMAPLFFVSPLQVNMAVPAGTVLGAASLTVRSGQGVFSIGTMQVAPVAPGIFTANSDGSGVAAAQVLRIRADGVRTIEPVARFDEAAQKFVAIPIDFGLPTDQLFLILYGTGIRFVSATDKVEVAIGGIKVDTQFAGPVEGFVGLDQINAVLKRSLAGLGEVNAVVKVDEKPTNTFKLAFR